MVNDPSLGVVKAKWNDLLEEAEAIGGALEAEDWRVIMVRPGDVQPRSKSTDVFGLNVVVPSNVFADIHELVEEKGVSFDDAEIYKSVEGGVVFIVISVLDTEEEIAVVIPVWYSVARGVAMLDVAREVGEMRTTIRPLDPTEEITFSHADPELFAPPHGRGDAGE